MYGGQMVETGDVNEIFYDPSIHIHGDYYRQCLIYQQQMTHHY